MHKNPQTPEELAEELLGRRFEDLDGDDRDVLRRIATGTVVGPNADELAALHATRADRLADRVAAVGGSWGFIVAFALVLFVWMLLNSAILNRPVFLGLGLKPFDGYPYIFLNLMLSMLAAIQAPVIMMSQNRQADKDRITARHDYEVNLRTQLEIIRLHRRFDQLVEHLGARRAAEDGEGG